MPDRGGDLPGGQRVAGVTVGDGDVSLAELVDDVAGRRALVEAGVQVDGRFLAAGVFGKQQDVAGRVVFAEVGLPWRKRGLGNNRIVEVGGVEGGGARRANSLTIRLTDVELDAITKRAEERGLSLSEYVRRQAMRGIA